MRPITDHPIVIVGPTTIVEVLSNDWNRYVDAEHYATVRRYRAKCSKCGNPWFERHSKSMTFVHLRKDDECCGTKAPTWSDVFVGKKKGAKSA